MDPKMGRSPGLKLKNKMASGPVYAAVGIGRRGCKVAVAYWRVFEGSERWVGSCGRVRYRPLNIHSATVISTERTGDMTLGVT